MRHDLISDLDTTSTLIPGISVHQSTDAAAATVIQKAFRGHSDRQCDSKVEELKAEVLELRSEEHLKYLTKELRSAKSALEQERKLRALQMDAIKVLWKEVQMMDATKGGRETDKSRPSGSIGSKISSRLVCSRLFLPSATKEPLGEEENKDEERWKFGWQQ